ncbi:MAG: 1-acyl-sn-glycerol-3-phosphate acyltransferase [Paludibacteraceae bacterium]|nr:1-acyl-sn-glycerol-3-phosphate acyltransferase [Paludibacteraceae bacterium]
MEQSFNFDEIRPYRDEEVHPVLMKLTKEPQLLALFPKLFPDIPTQQIVDFLQSIYTVKDFQKQVIHTYINRVEDKTTQGVQILGRENISNKKAYLFISNHRDIVLDSAFLNSNFFRIDLPLTEIAIGDNLLIYDWIRDLVKLNRSFIVQRNLPIRQMLESSERLSAYIRQTLTERNQSVWIAQREGRAKDSNDRTQEALLKMFNMSGTKGFVENMTELSICPLSISYEYDPCDYLKAKEFQQKRDNPDFKKTSQDDLTNMQTGINGYKGHVIFYIKGNINEEIELIRNQPTANRAEQLALMAELINKHIHLNYTIFSNNKVAYDLLTGANRFATEYDGKEKSAFETYIQIQLDKISLPNKDENFLRGKILEMYANPLINQLKAKDL